MTPSTPPVTVPAGVPPHRPRDTAIDLLRGWAIVGVVTIHVSGLALPASAYFALGYYFRWAVPIFICAYAFYAARPQPGAKPLALTVQRLRRVLWPFLAYSLLYAGVSGDLLQPDRAAVLLRYLRGDGWAGQYFFLILFQVIVLLPLLTRWRLGWRGVLVMLLLYSAAMWLLPTAWRQWPWLAWGGDRLVLYWLPYVLLGIHLRQHQQTWQHALQRLPAGSALALLLLAPLLLSASYDTDWPTGPYLLPWVALVSMLVFALHPAALAAAARQRVLQPLVYLGRYSLVVFCLNPLCIPLCSYLLRGINVTALHDALRALLALVLVAFSCALTAGVGAVLRRTPLRALAQ